MSYTTMDHAEWMERNNAAIRRHAEAKGKRRNDIPEQLSDFQKKVVDIIGIVGNGIYNAPISKKIDWNYGRGVSVIWKHDLATFDFSQLTMLVFLCHEARIRCDIQGAGPRQMRISFWERKAKGGISERHPNLDEAVADFRVWLPRDHRIVHQTEP